MLRRNPPWSAILLLSSGLLLAGCASAPVMDDRTGIAFFDWFLAFLANPNVAYLLLVLGLLSVIAEIATPGAIGPGVIGAILLLLSLFGLLQLPTNWLGLLLIVAGVVMLLLDINAPGFILSIGGIIAFLFGSLLLFGVPGRELPLSAVPVAPLNPFLVFGTTAVVAAFFILVVAAAYRAQRQPIAAGRETLIGQVGVARQPLAPTGIISVEGEEWSAENLASAPIPEGARVRVVGISGLTLQVEPEVTFERWSSSGPPPDGSPEP
jgi:membrane-bound serine protease (ClpP class)